MQKIKIAHIGFALIAMVLGVIFHSTTPMTQVSAATVIRSPSAHVTTRTAVPGSKFKVEIVMNNAIKNPKITSKSKKLKIVKYNVKKKTKTITITFQLAETATAGIYKTVINNNGKTKIVNIKIKKSSIQSNVNATAPSSLSVAGSQLSLGSSLSEVQNKLEAAGMIEFDKSKGVNNYDTDCYYYFNEDFDEKGNPVYSIGCAVEFYNGSLDRVVFGAKDWSFGKLSNSTKLKDVSTSSNSTRNVSGSENYKYKFHTEFYSNSTFTMYYDNTEEWNSPGWCLCEWKSIDNHSGKNSLKGKTVAMRLNNIIIKAFIEDNFPKLKTSALTKAFKKMDAFAIESGKQAVHLQNIYRVYHGLYPAVYSCDLAELAYAKAYVRSKLGIQEHVQPFVGNLSIDIIGDVGHSIRVNEWWAGCAQNTFENVGYGINSPLHEALTTIASTPHLETMLYGGFAAGAVILDSYSNFEGVANYKMNADEIVIEQREFIYNIVYNVMYDKFKNSDYDTWNEFYENIPQRYDYYLYEDEMGVGCYDDEAYNKDTYECYKPYMHYAYDLLGITDVSDVSPALVNYSWYVSNDLYELAFLNKENWINFKINKYDLKDSPGIEKFLALQYDNEIDYTSLEVYEGYDKFVNSCNELGEPSGHNARVENGELNKEQLIQVYIHFCEQVYDADFTNALASHFSCSTEDVYVKHSDVLYNIVHFQDSSHGTKLIENIKSYSEANGVPLKASLRMFLRYQTHWSQDSKREAIEMFKDYIDTTDLEAEFLS